MNINKKYLGLIILMIVTLVIGGILVFTENDASPARLIGDNSLKLSIAAMGGIFVRYFFEKRAKQETQKNDIKDFLLRLRLAYNNVKLTRRILRSHVINWIVYDEISEEDHSHQGENESRWLKQTVHAKREEYQEQMIKLMEYQLDLEALKNEADLIFGGKEKLLELEENNQSDTHIFPEEGKDFQIDLDVYWLLRNMEDYVRRITKEYSRISKPLFSDDLKNWQDFSPNEKQIRDCSNYGIEVNALGFLMDFTRNDSLSSGKVHLTKGYHRITSGLKSKL